jgi:multidrug resistance efflux pump
MRRRWLLVGAGVLLVVGLLAVLVRQPSTPPPTPTPVSAALVAHGQITPARQARVGTQVGGIVQQLDVSVGGEVAAQAPLAWVSSPSGTEVVTAPFSGWVTNVLVHTGDTLSPGTPIAIVADIHSLQVETSDVDEFLVSHVSVGQSVQVTVDALDNAAVGGTVNPRSGHN